MKSTFEGQQMFLADGGYVTVQPEIQDLILRAHKERNEAIRALFLRLASRIRQGLRTSQPAQRPDAVADLDLNAVTRLGNDVRSRMVADVFAPLGRIIRKRMQYARTVRELNALSDETLKDLGLSRSDIPWLSHSLVDESTQTDREVPLVSRARAFGKSDESRTEPQQPELPLAA